MIRRITILSATLATMSLFCLAIASAQITETKLVASDAGYTNAFGSSVFVYGDFALISAVLDDDNGESAGAAYIFQHDGTTWVERSKLIASDGEEWDLFGSSVSLSDNNAIVGARRDDDKGGDAGAAYIFHYDGTNWTEQAKLLGNGVKAQDEFGSSVSISGDYAMVGAHGYNGYNAGYVYVFQYDGSSWREQTRLVASDGSDYDWFGRSISLSGDYALIGADGGANGGSVYVFQREGRNWVEQAKLLASDGEINDFFGHSVSLSGDYALVGAYDLYQSDGGSAYVFHYNGSTWVEQAKLIASDISENDHFGISVSLSGEYALVGACLDGAASGSAYIFHHDGSSWVEQTKLKASDFAAGDEFGADVSLSGDYALVGARWNDGEGSAYIYSATAACDKVSQFQARCRPGGLIKARVTMADASHTGDILEISIDDVPYEVTVDATGRGQLSQGGFNPGPHTVELTNPGQCLDPIVVTCRTSLDEMGSEDWDNELISETPTETALLGNYPNPFNPSTTFSYTLSEPGQVSLRVYNTLGQLVRTIVDQEQVQGHHEAVWDGRNEAGGLVSSGIYIYRMTAGSYVETKRMLLLK